MQNNYPKKKLFNVSSQPPILKKITKPVSKPIISPKEQKLFSQFDLHPNILDALGLMQYTKSTPIQSRTAQYLHKDQDLLCLSETGSGKTLSFVLAIISFLVNNPTSQKGARALILAPTRELCLQISDYFNRFKQHGITEASFVVLYGGLDPMKQVLQLARNPQIIIATPGRLLDHLEHTKGFNLKTLKFLVLDQADKLLNKDFQVQFKAILALIPQERTTYLYSATLNHKVQQLEKVSLRKPVRVEVSHKYQITEGLTQWYVFIPSKFKDCYLVYLLNRFRSLKTIVFLRTRLAAERIALLLKQLQFSTECLHGEMSQPQRQKALEKFKKSEVQILTCTDVAARGIDIKMIDCVINYDLCDPKSYVHRVGRTARAGLKGQAISIVTQYDVEDLKRIEDKIGFRIDELPVNHAQAEVFLEKIQMCHQQINIQIKKKRSQYLFDS